MIVPSVKFLDDSLPVSILVLPIQSYMWKKIKV